VTLVQPRRNTAALAAISNPVLAMGELGYETDTKKSKRGDGVTTWNALPYLIDTASASSTYVPSIIPPVVGDRATDDAAVIVTALTLAATKPGSRVLITPGSTGVVVVSAGLLKIPSNTTLELAPGVTLQRKVGSLGNLINNVAVTAVRSVTDGAITTGTTAFTSATAAFTAADVGRTLVVAGAWGTNSPLTAVITAQTGTGATLSVAANTTVSGAVTDIYNRDRNISIIGSSGATIDGGANAAGTVLGTHHIRLRHIDGLTIRGITGLSNTGGKFFWSVGDATNIDADSLTYNTFSDGFHVAGPARSVRITGQRGTTGDDMIAFTGNDYVGYNDTAGDISDVEVVGVYPVGSMEAVKINSGLGNKFRRFTIRTIKGTVVQHGITSNTDTASPSVTVNDCDDMSISDVSIAAGSGFGAVHLFHSAGGGGTYLVDGVSCANTGARSLMLRDNAGIVTARNIKDTATPGVLVQTASTVAALTLDGANLSNSGTVTVLRNTRVQPSLIVPSASSVAVAAVVVWFGANQTIMNRFQVPGGGIFRYVNLYVGASSGNIQVGVVKLGTVVAATQQYAAPIMTSGVIACPAANAVVRIDCGATWLPPGDYAVFLWCDNTTASFLHAIPLGVSARRDTLSQSLSGGLTVASTASYSSRLVSGLTLEADI